MYKTEDYKNLFQGSALHELGHAIGLDHNFDGMSVMNYNQPNEIDDHLMPDDVRYVYTTFPNKSKNVIDMGIWTWYCNGYKSYSFADAEPWLPYQGENIRIDNIYVGNLSNSDQSGTIVKAYLSSDTTITTSDIYIGEFNFDRSWTRASGALVSNLNFTIPTNVTPGDYYFGMIIYADGTTTDSITYNNTAYLPVLITVKQLPPTVTTDAASGVSSTGATLNGTVNANNASTTVTFQYGLTTSYGSTVTATQSPVTGSTNTAVSKAITGLTPSTTYHYRAVGVNSAETTNGDDMTFTTSASEPIPKTLTGLSISSGPDSVDEGNTGQYAATASFSDGTSQAVTPSWSLSSTTYATIDTSGLLTAKTVTANKSVTVYASYTYGSVTKTASKTVTINDVTVPKTLTGLSISGPDSVDEGNTGQYAATAIFSDGTSQAVTPSWSLSSEDYATINASGQLTAKTVTENKSVTVYASYTYGSVTKTASKTVTIKNVNGIVLFAPTLNSPANNALNQPRNVKVLWIDTNNSNPQETGYKVRWKRDGAPRYMESADLPTGTTSYAITGLLPGVKYWWSVKSVGDGTTTVSSSYASDRAFTVDSATAGVWAWGMNTYGQLGDGTTSNRTLPVQVKDALGTGYLTDVVVIGVGYAHTLALKSNGTVWAWGLNTYGQLGDETTNNRTLPVQVKDASGNGYLTDVISIVTGGDHSLALKSDGTVWTWGDNDVGQLGDGTTSNRTLPVQVKDTLGNGYLTNVIAIGGGTGLGGHSLALKSDGTVWAWGDNDVGQLGDGTASNRTLPVQVKDALGNGYLTEIIAIVGKYHHSFALKSDGTVWAWGMNSYGQLGDGTTFYYRLLPIQVKDASGTGYLTDAIAITGGSHSSFALKSDGTVWAWGNNFNGVLGDGTTTDRSLPVQVKDTSGTVYLTNITSITRKYNHSFALKSDGTVWAWGMNSYGQLGDGAASNRTLPVQVKDASGNGYLTDIVSVVAGGDNSFALQISPATIPETTPPSAPADVNASDGSYLTTIRVSWTDTSDNEEGFKIYRSTTQSGTYTQIGTAVAGATYYDDSCSCGGTKYWYKVAAYNSGGSSGQAGPNDGYTATCPPILPSAPADVNASDGSYLTTIRVSWTDTSDNEEGFKIYRSTTQSGTYTQIGTAVAGATYYDDSRSCGGTKYWYKVAAYNSGGSSGQAGPNDGYTKACQKMNSLPWLPLLLGD